MGKRTSACGDASASGSQSSTVVHFAGSHVHGSPAWHLEQFIAAAAPGVAALRERRIALLEDDVEREFAYLAAQQHSDGFLADLHGFVDELDEHTSTVLHDGNTFTFGCGQQSQQQQQLSGLAAPMPSTPVAPSIAGSGEVVGAASAEAGDAFTQQLQHQVAATQPTAASGHMQQQRVRSAAGESASPTVGSSTAADVGRFAAARSQLLFDACLHACGDRATAALWHAWCLAWHTVDALAVPSSLVEWHLLCGGAQWHSSSASRTAAFSGLRLFHSGDMIDYAASCVRAGARVGLLDMACASRAGGGFLKGSRAQEERLCARSALFPRLCLYASTGHYPLVAGSAVAVRGVCLLRDSAFNAWSGVQPNVDVIAAAAPRYQSEAAARADVQLETRLTDLWCAVLVAAASSGVDVLVVSALGAGAYHNPPEVVARALVAALEQGCPAACSCRAIIMAVVNDEHGHRGGGNVARMRRTLCWGRGTTLTGGWG